MNGRGSPGMHAFLLILILALPSLACGVLSGGEELQEDLQQELQGELPAAVEEALEQPAAVEEPASSQEDDDLRAPISGALRPDGVVDAVRVTVTSENLDTGDTTVSTAAFIQPDSYFLADDTIDAFIAGGKSYVKNDQGGYDETFDMSFIVAGLVTTLIDPWATEAGLVMVTLAEPEGGSNLVGEETLRGVKTQIYEYAIPLPAAVSEEPILYRVWIGADDELAYRQVIEHPVERTRSTLEFEYDGVEIPAPGS